MSDPKTQPTQASVEQFLKSIDNEARRKDCEVVIEFMKQITSDKPVMWGSSIIGFGKYHYKYATGREGDWPITAVSPRKQNLTVYIMPGFSQYQNLMEKLGKHTTGSSCLYIKSLKDVDVDILKELIQKSVQEMKKRYPA